MPHRRWLRGHDQWTVVQITGGRRLVKCYALIGRHLCVLCEGQEPEGVDLVLSSGFMAFAKHAGFLQAVDEVSCKKTHEHTFFLRHSWHLGERIVPMHIFRRRTS